MKRFAFAVPGDLSTPTGGYAYDRRMIAELGNLGWQIDIIALGEGFPFPSEATRKTANERLLAVPHDQIVVIDGLALGVLPEAATKLGRLLALVHHPLAVESGISAGQAEQLRASEQAALSSARHVVVTSATTAQQLSSHYAVPAGRITVVRPGSDPVAQAQRSANGTVRLLSVGAVVPRKGYDVLIAALATLPDLPWRLTIAGDCTRNRNAAAQLQADIDRHGLGSRVVVLGAVSPHRLGELYAEADIFALASRFEGYGMAYAEAIAHGLPVIGTIAGAIPSTVPPDSGLLVAPDDVTALAAALRRLIGDANERKRFASAARKAAAQFPTWAESARIFSRTLEAIA
ncbi:MAG TPA: glycosyltransferase family 4 protein [Pseudolabrys sp.]